MKGILRRLLLRLAFGRNATVKGIAARVVEHALHGAGRFSVSESKRLISVVILALAEAGFF